MQIIHKIHMRRWLLPGLLGLAMCSPVPVTYAATIETGFSPEGTALRLVLKTIDTAQQEIRLMGYPDKAPGDLISKCVVSFKNLLCTSFKYIIFISYKDITYSSPALWTGSENARPCSGLTFAPVRKHQKHLPSLCAGPPPYI